MKVWIVSVGEYSDCYAVAVFDEHHEEAAEKAAKLMGGQLSESLVLNDFPLEEPPAGLSFFEIRAGTTGTPRVDDYESVLNEKGQRYKEHYSTYSIERTHHSDWQLAIVLYARNKAHAAEIANDLRTQILAGAKPLKGELP